MKSDKFAEKVDFNIFFLEKVHGFRDIRFICGQKLKVRFVGCVHTEG